MENTSWNNIPLPLKEMISVLINAHIKIEDTVYKRKRVNNERVIDL